MCCPSLTDKASVSGAEDRGSIPLGSTIYILLLFSILAAAVMSSAFAEQEPLLAREFGKTPPFVEYNTSNGIAGYKPEKPIFKHYPKTPRVLLPVISNQAKSGSLATMSKRRSRRRFAKGPLSLDELAQLLHAAAGISGQRWSVPLRTAPSGGALFPIEVYVAIHHVQGLKPGIYHLAVEDFALERLRDGLWKSELAWASIDQTGKANECCTIILTQMRKRIEQKYGPRGAKYGWIELGASMQNILLVAEDLGLATVPIGAFHDSRVRKILGIADTKEEPGILIPVGRRKKLRPDK